MERRARKARGEARPSTTAVYLLAGSQDEARAFQKDHPGAVIVGDVHNLAVRRGGTVILCGTYYDRISALFALEIADYRGMRVLLQAAPGTTPRSFL